MSELLQVNAKIKELQDRAKELESTERKGIVDRINIEIELLNIKPKELNFKRKIYKTRKPKENQSVAEILNIHDETIEAE